MSHIVNANKKVISKTPRTDRQVRLWSDLNQQWVKIGFARQLERQLAGANTEIEEKRKDVVWLATEKAKLENYVMLLEEAGDAMELYCDAISADNWRKAKEAKP